MATITNRESLAKYILEELGSPVIHINVSDEQISNAIDKAIQYFTEFAYDGTYTAYISKAITQTEITNKYITIDSDIIGIEDVTFVHGAADEVQADNLFSIFYDLKGDLLSDTTSGSLSYQEISRQYIEDIKNMFHVNPRFSFNRVLSRLFINKDMTFVLGQYMIMKAKKISGNTAKFYNSIPMKELATEFLKKAWGNNLKKFESVQLPGGVTISGQAIYQEADDAITRKLEELRNTHSEPPSFFMA